MNGLLYKGCVGIGLFIASSLLPIGAEAYEVIDVQHGGAIEGVVTLSGDRYAGRLSESFLRATGLDGLVAGSIGEFVQISKNLASDVDSLNQLRLSTRDRVRTSKLFDENLFADDFMSVLNSVWSQSEVVAA